MEPRKVRTVAAAGDVAAADSAAVSLTLSKDGCVDAPPRLVILDLSSGDRLSTYIIRQTDRAITVLIGSPRGGPSSESTFMRLVSRPGDNLVLENFREPHTGGRAGVVVWRAIEE